MNSFRFSFLISLLLYFPGMPSLFSLQLDRVILSVDGNPDYVYFWPYAAKAWKQIVGIEPTLVVIEDGREINIDETLGTIIRVKKDPLIPSYIQAAFIREFIPILFPNEVCIISDIDQVPAQRAFFQDTIKDFHDQDLVIYREIASDSSYSKQFPMSYVAGRGSVFREIFSISTLQDIINLMNQLATDFIPQHEFASDQIYLYEKITSWSGWPKRVQRLGHDWIYKKLHYYDKSYGIDLLKSGFYFDVQLVKKAHWDQYPSGEDFNNQIFELFSID